MTSTSSFELIFQENHIATIRIDVKNEPQNTLKAEFADQIQAIFTQIKNNKDVHGVVIISGKPDGFIAGADIKVLEKLKTIQDAVEVSRVGHQTFQQMNDLGIPVVAAIHGPCLGGGLELALACHGRVCTDSLKTTLGLPEVQLGLLPGGGGTQRLPKLIGIANALDMMLTGRQLKPKQAKKLGLVDEVTPQANLVKAAYELVNKIRAGKFSRQKSSLTTAALMRWALEDNKWGRQILFQQARKKLLAKTLGNYPAPEYIIDCVEAGAELGEAVGYAKEAELFGELVKSAEAKQLIGLFFASTELKKESGIAEKDFAQLAELKPVSSVGVLGGGLMGAGIAYVSIEKANIPVRLKDRDADGVLHGLKYSHNIYDKRLKKGYISLSQKAEKMSMLTGTTDYSGFAQVDIVIEAVFEDLQLKQQMLREVEKIGRADIIFATNTSSIPISEIAKASQHPETVIGLHYFSPVDKMPLLEIIKTPKTSAEVVARSVAFGKKQGKTVIVVNDGPGFYTSRILAPYMNEAGHIVAEGVAIDKIDSALKKYGFPIGPITLLDEVGIDVGTKIAPILESAFGERMAPPASFSKLIDAGRKGKKNKKGFYVYPANGKGPKVVDESVYKDLGIQAHNNMDAVEIAERCVLQMVNEAARCLEEGILNNARDGDIGAVFGLGFPAFLGGPFHYCDSQGIQVIVDKLKHFETIHGSRFTPAKILLEKIKQNQGFFE